MPLSRPPASCTRPVGKSSPTSSLRQTERLKLWLRAPNDLARWIDALVRSARSGLPVKFLYDLSAPVVVREYAETENANWYNAAPVPVKLGDVRRLFPDDVNEEMGPLDSVANHFGGGGVGIDIYRIQDSKYLIFVVSRDGGD